MESDLSRTMGKATRIRAQGALGLALRASGTGLRQLQVRQDALHGLHGAVADCEVCYVLGNGIKRSGCRGGLDALPGHCIGVEQVDHVRRAPICGFGRRMAPTFCDRSLWRAPLTANWRRRVLSFSVNSSMSSTVRNGQATSQHKNSRAVRHCMPTYDPPLRSEQASALRAHWSCVRFKVSVRRVRAHSNYTSRTAAGQRWLPLPAPSA